MFFLFGALVALLTLLPSGQCFLDLIQSNQELTPTTYTVDEPIVIDLSYLVGNITIQVSVSGTTQIRSTNPITPAIWIIGDTGPSE